MVHDDQNIETLLACYRPAGPPAGLRARVLHAGNACRPRGAMAGWLSMAAMLALSCGLYLDGERLNRGTAATLGTGSIGWTAEAEEAAQMLNGHGSGRRYVELALACDGARAARRLRQGAPASLLGGVR